MQFAFNCNFQLVLLCKTKYFEENSTENKNNEGKTIWIQMKH